MKKSDSDHERLEQAYRERSVQLVDTRAALAQAVASLTEELRERRDRMRELVRERDIAVAENRALRDRGERAEAERDELVRSSEELRVHALAVEHDLGVLRGTKLMRYSARARRAVYRLRARRG